ncbi:hypothetical protein WEH80_23145 [Actinomycetes bacterium KLBMP 9759]
MTTPSADPAWRRPTRGEHRWPAALAVAVAIVLQMLLPDVVAPGPWWLLPGIELLLLGTLVIANPFRVGAESNVLRVLGIGLAATVGIAAAWSVVSLVGALVGGRFGGDAATLLATGASIWITNIIASALLYWEFDRGGPAARARGGEGHPDFLFVQMQVPEMADPEWEPTFADYLYLSFTNSTAFSPTDTMPLSRWAKMTMMFESVVSLATVALVVARAVNVLGG